MSCQLCCYLSPNIRTHISHIRQVHSNCRGFSLLCGIEQCSRQFTTFGAYNSHVYRVHRSVLGLDIPTNAFTSGDLQGSSSSNNLQLEENEMGPAFCFEDHNPPEEIQYDVWHLLGVDRDKQTKETAAFLLKLKEICNVSERTIGEVIAGYRGLLTKSLSVAKASVKDVLGNADICMSDVNGLDHVFTSIPDVFEGLDTTYKQEKYFKDHFHLLVRIYKYNSPQKLTLLSSSL